jgi:hypothetical protein
MTSQSQAVKRTAQPASVHPAAKSDGTIELNTDEIRKMAYNISTAKRSYDDYVWVWAEQELKVGKALQTPLAMNMNKIKVDASKIVEKPKESDIKKLAIELAKRKVKVQDIHWYIAERQFIQEKATQGS